MRKNESLSLAQKALFLSFVFFPSYLLSFQLGPLPSNVYEGLLAFTFLVFLYEQGPRAFASIFRSRFGIFSLVFIMLTLFATLQALFSNTLEIGYLLTALKVSLVSLFALALTQKLFLETKKEVFFYWAIVLGASGFALWSFVDNYLLQLHTTWDHRLLGPMDSAVYLAYYLSPALLLSFGLPRSKWRVALQAILLGGILATKSFGAVLALSSIFVFWLWKTQRSKLKAWHYFSVTLFGLALLGLTFFHKILPAFQLEYSSLGERFQIWLTAFHGLQNPWHFFGGFGLYQFQALYESLAPSVLGKAPMDSIVLQPHNFFLWTLGNYGLPGLALLLASLWQFLQKSLHTATLPLGLLLFAYFFTHGQLDTPFFRHENFFLLLWSIWTLWNKKA